MSKTCTPSTTDNDQTTLPGVSVIIPAFNYAEYLSFAIDSVLAQDYPIFELIVVNDGSTDATPQVLDQYQDKIRAIHQENQGLPTARNTGIQAAKFPLLAFLDADDAWRPGLLMKIARALQSLPPETGIVACLSRTINHAGQTIRTRPATASTAHLREIYWHDILLKTRFGSSGLTVARACFEKCGLFDTTLNSSEDRDMWLRIAEHFRVFLIHEDLALIRRHDRNMSTNPDRMKTNMLRVIKSALNRTASPDKAARLKAKTLSYCFFETAWMYHNAGQHRQAVKDIIRSLLLHPFPISTKDVEQPALFRCRALIRFLIAPILKFKKHEHVAAQN